MHVILQKNTAARWHVQLTNNRGNEKGNLPQFLKILTVYRNFLTIWKFSPSLRGMYAGAVTSAVLYYVAFYFTTRVGYLKKRLSKQRQHSSGRPLAFLHFFKGECEIYSSFVCCYGVSNVCLLVSALELGQRPFKKEQTCFFKQFYEVKIIFTIRNKEEEKESF